MGLNLASERHFTPDQYNSIQTTILSISIFKDSKMQNQTTFLIFSKPNLWLKSWPTYCSTYLHTIRHNYQSGLGDYFYFIHKIPIGDGTFYSGIFGEKAKKFVTQQNRQDTYYENSHYFLT